MPDYRVEAVEKFLVRTTYYVSDVESHEEAERLCKAGEIPYDGYEVVEGDEEWVETDDVSELPS